MDLTVECHAGYRGDETPLRFRMGERAVEIDPTYAPAWVGLVSPILVAIQEGRVEREAGLERANAAIRIRCTDQLIPLNRSRAIICPVVTSITAQAVKSW